MHGDLMVLLHVGAPLEPHDLARAWSFEPAVIAGLAITAWLYTSGILRLWQRAGIGHGVSRGAAATFAAGWFALFLALVSPLHRLGGALFSAHMVQHELLVAIGAPLLVLGQPLVPFLFGLPRARRQSVARLTRRTGLKRVWRVLSAPLPSWMLHAAALWVWHLPGPYAAALDSDAAHTLQQLSFLGTALLFWWAILHGRTGRLGYGASAFYLFATALYSSGLGALITFASRPWYPSYEQAARGWGLTALQDQQLAGVIMWVPGAVAYVIAALALLAFWMRESDVRLARWQKPAVRLS
jgi:putative membrane protein